MLCNLNLFWDLSIVYTFAHTRYSTLLPCLLLFMYLMKMVKPYPHLSRYPQDFLFLFFPFPGYIIFGYVHSLISVWALLTVGDSSWPGRDVVVQSG